MSSAPLCWTNIGVWGDRTCAELPRVGHCHNCEVYSAGGNELFARPVPSDYLDLWTELLAREKETASEATIPYVVFRIGESWLALRAVVLREIIQPGVIRMMPHRHSNVLLGVTAVRGEIYPCVSLHALIGDAVPESVPPTARFLVATQPGGDWVLLVDEVNGIHDVLEIAIEPLPATLARTGSMYTMGIAQCDGRPVGLVDEGLLFSALERGIA